MSKQSEQNTESTSMTQLSTSLHGTIHSPAALTHTQRAQMLVLLSNHFENVSPNGFADDLAEKEWVVLLCDDDDMVQGFSTLMRMHESIDGRNIIAFYSGDTIIHPNFWGEAELPRIWGRHVFDLAGQIRADDPDAAVYWFLISSGYKTYRFLPVFFRDFYPHYDCATPAYEQEMLHALAHRKFGNGYDPATGLIRFDSASQLREGVAEVTEARLRDPHVNFFVNRNPDHTQGAQLACLVELTTENLTRCGRRIVITKK